jgi:hypothetical protein
MKRCIIVQGPTYDNSINQIRECFNGYPIIFSTWAGYENYYTQNDNTIFSQLPHNSGVKNLNYQKSSTLAGLKLAKELGYERALKWRSDMWSNNYGGLMDTFTDGYNTLCWIDSEGGYLSDFFMEDSVDNLIKVWDIRTEGSFPEKIITDRVVELGWIERTNLIISSLTPEVDVYWNSRYGAYWMNKLNNENMYKNNKTWIKK